MRSTPSQIAGLSDTLGSSSLNVTVFAPTNDAFIAFANEFNLTMADVTSSADTLAKVRISPGADFLQATRLVHVTCHNGAVFK